MMNNDDSTAIREFLQQLANPLVGEQLFDQFDNTTFFVKDGLGRYLVVNQTLALRCGSKTKTTLIGRTAAEVHPPPLGNYFLAQDIELIRTGRPLVNEMEQHPYPRRKTGWCLTTKLPLQDQSGTTIGLVGMSRDLQSADQGPQTYASLSKVIRFIKANLSEPLKTGELAEMAGFSVWQLDQRIRELFGLTTAQLVLQLKMEAASKRLRESSTPIVSIAMDTGYANQSAFSRQFRKTFGMPPGDYRRDHENQSN